MSDATPMTNVNVTLDRRLERPTHTFPCPICGTALEVRDSRAHKPYCVCNSTTCGLQIFFRGKHAISRLRALLDREQSWAGPTTAAVALFGRIEQLRAQRKELEHKRGLLFTDDDLELAIRAVDLEITHLQRTLGELAEGIKS